MKTERLMTLFLLLGSSWYLYFASKLTFGTIDHPGSGFMPMLAGITAVVAALFLLVRQFRANASPPPPAEAINWTTFVLIQVGFLFYILLFDLIGYFLSSFILLLYLFKICDFAGWRYPFLTALITSTSFYFIFKRCLEVSLP